MTASKRRSYTATEREKILASVRKLGVNAAAEKHGVPQSCVSRWAAAAGVKREAKVAARGGRPTKGVAVTTAASPSAPAEATSSAPTREGRVLRKSRVARMYTPSQKAEVLEYAAAHGVTEASRKFDISRFSIYDWRGKVAKAAKGDGASPTSGPDAGYRPPKVTREPHDQRYEAVRPNHLWHLDFVHRHINRASTFTLILIDDHSRYVVGHGVDEGAATVERLVGAAGARVVAIDAPTAGDAPADVLMRTVVDAMGSPAPAPLRVPRPSDQFRWRRGAHSSQFSAVTRK